MLPDYFNPRTRASCDGKWSNTTWEVVLFQSTHARELRPRGVFYRTIDLVTELVEKHRTGHLGKTLEQLLKLDLLILDELGYIPIDKTSSQLLFHVISNSYQQQSVIITSNSEFGRWNEIFRDDRLTAAIIDRLVHHAYILGFSGPSYRYREAITARAEGISQTTQMD